MYQPKTNQSYHQTLEDIMSQKVRIRNRRNLEAESRVPKTQRALSEHQKNQFDQESVQSQMAKTTKDFYKTMQRNGIQRKASMREGNLTNLDLNDPSG